ncbi:single-stranded-DNA-specific exonuclease RecJ [Patescibacteria group bacterium]|nr:single-stranded-DNA-specific exonuclease RecJ [Patescibacteria group bacterium]
MEKEWIIQPEAPESFFAEHPELPKVVANLLYHRGIIDSKKIDEFLNPDYTQDVHDPFLFFDMKKAVDRIFEAIEKQERIVVHGDYDADGVCSSAILNSTLKALGLNKTNIFLPHREVDGYGLNKNTVQLLADEKTDLVITCDCGITNIEEVEMANEKGIDVIISDHHSVPDILPPAFAIIHPQRKDDNYPDQGLCGAGVAFKIAQALIKKHAENNEKMPNGDSHEGFEKWMLGLVAIATVADMVPLLGESRTLTKYGLVVLNKTKRIGLQKLLLEARLVEENGDKKHELDTETIGFKIAPRINAAGRMNHANVAYNLMMTDDPIEAADLAFELNKNNQDRQKITENLVKQALEQIEKNQKDSPVLFVLGNGWSTGIIGLIAGKIKEKFYKPTLIMTENDGEITGSGRSIEGFSIVDALQSMPEHFSKFGGHPMACGFTLKSKSDIEPFKEKMVQKFNEVFSGEKPKSTILIDTQINLEDVNWELHDILEKFQPFGQSNEKPRYLAKGLSITSIKPMGKNGNHITLMVKHNTENIRKTIGWNLCAETDGHTNWCKTLKQGDKVDLVFEVDINEWNGNRELQLTIKDINLSS